MKFLISDRSNREVVCSLDEYCKKCSNSSVDYTKVICPNNNEERRYGIKEYAGGRIFICTSKSNTKTTKLFKEKIEMLSYCIPSFMKIKEKAIADASNLEKEKYSKIVHNLKTLNGQSIQYQYKFVPQNIFADNYHNLYEFLKSEIIKRPHDATITILRLSKNNAHMKTEFSTHEKLSVENPNLLIQEHNVISVILNVYHSFDIDFRENNVQFKISDIDHYLLFDYDTIRVALYHIFSNTIKYVCKNSIVNVKIYNEENMTYVDFKMKSLHIAKEEKNKIFEDNYSGKSTTSKRKNGSGLGMGLIRKALSINNAEIEVICGEKSTRIEGQDFSDNTFRLIFNK